MSRAAGDEPLPVRRLEAVVRRDADGAVDCAGLLESTLRHRGGRLLVEAPPPGLDTAELDRLAGIACDAARAAALQPGWHTVELQLAGSPEVVGMASGLPRGVAALEAVVGLDLRGAATGAAADPPRPLPAPRGHALSTRLAAFDPELALAPSRGAIETLQLPAGAGVCVETSLAEGDLVTAQGGAEIVWLTAQAPDRAAALARLRAAVARTHVTLAGGATDKAFLVGILERPEIAAGAVDARWLAGVLARGEQLSRRGAAAALVAAAALAYESRIDEAKRRFLDAAQRGRPEVVLDGDGSIELRLLGAIYLCRVAKLAPHRYRVGVEGRTIELGLEPAGGGRARLSLGDRRLELFTRADARGVVVEVDGVPHRLTGDPSTILRSPLPAIVSRVETREGDDVEPGQPLLVLEAMKMETVLVADRPGRVRRLLVRANAQVGVDEPLLVVEPSGRPAAADAADGARLDLAELARPGAATAAPAGRARAALDEARRLFLGYDVEPRAVSRALAEVPAARDGAHEPREDETLRAYLDVLALFRPRPTEDEDDELRRSVEEYLFTYLRDLDQRGTGLPAAFLDKLRRALAHYGVRSLERTRALEEALFRLVIAHQRQAQLVPPVVALLERRLEPAARGAAGDPLAELIDRLLIETRDREPALYDLAREVRYRRFDRRVLEAERERQLAAVARHLEVLARGESTAAERAAAFGALIDTPQRIHAWFSARFAEARPALRAAMLETLVRRYYRIRSLGEVVAAPAAAGDWVSADYDHLGARIRLVAAHGPRVEVEALLARLRDLTRAWQGQGLEIVVDLYLAQAEAESPDAMTERLAAPISAAGLPADVRRVAIALAAGGEVHYFTFRRPLGSTGPFEEERLVRGLHPMVAKRLQLWRLSNFDLERLPASDWVHLFRGVARDNPEDERLFALGETRDLTPIRDAEGRVSGLPELERIFLEAAAAIRRIQNRRPAQQKLHWNRIVLAVWPPLVLTPRELAGIVRRLAPHTSGLGLEKVVVHGQLPAPPAPGESTDWVLEISDPGQGAPSMRFREPSLTPLKPLREYAQAVVDLRRRGLPHPFEIVRRLAPSAEVAGDFPPGDFVEHDLDAEGRLVPVDRPPGRNSANVVVGVVRNFTARYPEGMARVILLGDAARGMGALAEPECRRISAALDLAERMEVPLEWFALSAGARIAMDSGTENMDWIGRVLRRLIEFTQGGGEVNIVVVGINVGAQPYWNAEATMLMHTRGILVMTPDAAMVLTGKRALDFSGGVSAEDNLGIGGYQRIMGPNGQAQYLATDLADAGRILLAHYDHTYVLPGERFPRAAATADPRQRDIRDAPHGGDFATVGEVFSDATNPGRKKPFEIRRVMAAVADQDHPPLERWPDMRDAEIAVVWDAHLGGHPICLLGFESRPIPRLGWVPAYGPRQWTGGTLFPQSSKKIARAINAASGNRPLVVLANLSGFDGSPESMRRGQLEFGAEIGRAVVNFRGPVVFVVVSRYHGGAFVVFSATLHDNMQVAALEGSAASVIGGAPAAAVVFAREVEKRARRDPRVAELERALAEPGRGDRAELQRRLVEALDGARSEKLGEVAVEYDRIHDIERARRVGSVQEILPAARLRPWLIDAVERGMARELARATAAAPGRRSRP